MKHDFSIQEIVGALKKARGLQNYYTDAQLAHLFDMGREINDVLHYLPEPGPDSAPVDGRMWEQCKTSDLQDGDEYKLIGEDWEHTGTVKEVQGLERVFTEAFNPEKAICYHPGTGKLIRLAEIDGTDELTLLRKPKPVVHPDPMEDHIIHCHDRINDYFWNGVVGSYMGLYDPRIQLSKEDFTNWSPAIIVTGETNG